MTIIDIEKLEKQHDVKIHIHSKPNKLLLKLSNENKQHTYQINVPLTEDQLVRSIDDFNGHTLWEMRNGQKVKICDMTTNHIENSIKMSIRHGFISSKTYKFYLSCKQPSGDAARISFDREFDIVMCKKPSKALSYLQEEYKKRTGKEIEEIY